MRNATFSFVVLEWCGNRMALLRACRTFVVFVLLTAAARAADPTDSGPLSLPKPGATSADEPYATSLSLPRAGEFLDRAARSWVRDHGCASCHTSYPYLMARPMLGDDTAPALIWTRNFLENRVAGWDRGGKGAGLPMEDDEAVSVGVEVGDGARSGVVVAGVEPPGCRE